MSKVFFFVIIK